MDECQNRVVDEMVGRVGARAQWLSTMRRSVAEAFCVNSEDIQGRVRTRGLVEARQCYYLVARTCTRLSLPELGTALGRDHTTVLSGVRAALKRMTHDAWYDKTCKQLIAMWEDQR